VAHFDCDLTDRAAELYAQEHERQGFTEAQLTIPSRAHSGREADVIILRSGDWELARFRIVARRGEEALVRVDP
jgi:hypothetical protein